MINSLLEKNLLPDIAIRFGIRRLLAQRLREETVSTKAEQDRRLEAFAADLHTQPIAINTQESKEQHYEVPTAFYQRVLGPRLKYSSCWFERGGETLAEGQKFCDPDCEADFRKRQWHVKQRNTTPPAIG